MSASNSSDKGPLPHLNKTLPAKARERLGGAVERIAVGRDITLADYAGYAAPVEAGESVKIRVEQVDLTFLIFVQNQRDRATDVELDFQLAGMQSDAGTAMTVTVPARTEVLASILRPMPGATRIQYGYSIRYR